MSRYQFDDDDQPYVVIERHSDTGIGPFLIGLALARQRRCCWPRVRARRRDATSSGVRVRVRRARRERRERRNRYGGRHLPGRAPPR